MFERMAMSDTPLRDISKINRKDVIQVFFKSQANICDTWVLDEKGSVCHIQQNHFNRSAYISHWLYVIRNIRNRLKKINYQEKELPALEIFEISSNRLGEVQFHSVGAEDVTTGSAFVDVQVVVEGDGTNENVSLICEGKNFDFDVYGDNVVAECVRYISGRINNDGMNSVYVTDVNAPLRMYGVEDREDMQLVHFLKYIRNVETMLNKLLHR